MSADPVADGAELTASEKFNELFSHLNPHTLFDFQLFGIDWNITNHVVVMWLAGLLVLLFFRWAHAGRRALRDGSVPHGRAPNLAESLVLFVRDQMVYDTMGPEVGRRYAPLFLTQFFFIWFVNILSSAPLPKQISGAPTASFMVTTALATVTLAAIVAGGIKTSGPIGMWRDLMPKGLPPVIREILVLVELMGFFIRPLALTIRLFANIFGGHLVVLSLFGLIYVFESWVIGVALFPMVIFVGLLEMLVAALQAFIFTFLSIMFVQAAVHPEH